MADTTEKKTYLIDIKSNYQQYIDDLKKAKEEQQRQKAALDQLTEAQKQDKDLMEKLSAEYRKAQTDVKNATKIVDQATLANKAQKGSYEELYRTWQVAQTQLKLMGGAYTTNAQGVRVLSEKYIQQKQVVEDAKRSLDAFGKGVADNRLNVGNYSEAIEGAIGKFQMMPGPVGAAAGSLQKVNMVFKSLIANPIMAAIAAIIAVFAGLVKIFKGTAEGGGKIKELFAAIGAIISELRARVVSFIDIFSHIFKGEWKEAGDAAKETFTGLSDSLKEATKSAMEMQRAQKQLNEEIAMHISENAEEEKQMEELLFLSKDRTKSDADRIEFLRKYFEIRQINAKAETEFAERQYQIDITNAARTTKIKKETLDQWVRMNKDAQLEMLKNNKEIQDAFNKLGGADALKVLEESYSKQINAQKEFFTGSKRAITTQSSLEEELKRDKETKNKEHLDRLKKQSDDNVKLMMLEAEGNAEKTKEVLKFQYEEELRLNKLSNTEKLILKKEYENAVTKVDKEVADKRKDAYNKADKENEDFINREIDRMDKLAEIKKIDAEAGFEYQRMKAGENVNTLQTILDLEYGAMLKSVEYKNATTNEKLLIDQQYTENSRQLSLLRTDQQMQELNLVGDIMGSMAGLFGKQTIAAKALSVAQALISTYTAGVKAMAELPLGSGPILRFLTLASVIAAGLLQVKNILAVKVPGGEGGSVSMPTVIAGSLPAQKAYAPSVGATFLNQPQLTQTQLNAVPNQNLLTAEQIANAMSKMPAPIVTVEDINAKVTAGRKIEVRATI